MKKIYLFILFVVSMHLQAQQNTGTPVNGVTTITREALSTPYSNAADVMQTNSVTVAGTPTGSSPEVGTTEGDLSVSLSGAATYSLPIAVPPGINGVSPVISLSYNSQSGSGMAGYGWNIAGVSVISRIPSTRYHDGVVDGIDFDSYDRFALDGQRLLLKSGTYGGDGAVYETENFSNIKVTSYGVSPYGAGYGPAYFLVQYPDGAKAYFGNDALSRSRMEWGISYWENQQAIRIKYSYTTVNNNLNLTKIEYGSRASESQINSIEFIYKDRQRNEHAYVQNTLFIRKNLLSTIRVLGNGTMYRTYSLIYDQTNLWYERLTLIREYSPNATKQLNPILFSYDNTPEILSYSDVTSNLTVGNINLNNSTTVPGDYSGDGKMDFIVYPTSSASKNKYWVFDNLTGTQTNIGAEHQVGAFEEIFPVTWINYQNKVMPGQGWSVVKKFNNTLKFTVYSRGTVSPIYYQYEKTVANFSGPFAVNIPTATIKVLSGDFKATGYTDAVVLIKNTTGQGAFFIDLRNGSPTPGSYNASIGTNIDNQHYTGDFNGDGKLDVFEFSQGNVKVFSVNDSNQLSQLISFSEAKITTTRTILMGDYNGDGKTDFIIPLGNGQYYAKYLSAGTTFIKTEATYDIPYQQSGQYSTYHTIANDLNNDGKTDLILVETFRNEDPNRSYHESYLKGFISIRVYRNMENNFVSDMYATTEYKENIKYYPVPVFLSSDNPNRSLEIAFISNNEIHHFKSQKDFSKEKLLRSITTSNGVTETITYATLNNECTTPGCLPVYIANPYTEVYPNADIEVAPSFLVVSRVERQSTDTYKKQTFQYLGAVYNAEGLGFMGFRSLLKTNWYNQNSQVISTITKYDIAKRGAVSETFSVAGLMQLYAGYNPTNYISKSVLTYENELFANKVYKIRNTALLDYNGLEGTSREVTTTYDTFNNPLTVNIVSKQGTTIQQTHNTQYEYFNSSWELVHYYGRPKRKFISITHNGETLTSEELYSLNSNHQLVKVRKKGHNTDYITEDNVYDMYGNLTKRTISAPGESSRAVSYGYDVSGRFLSNMTDVHGVVSGISYSSANGLILAESQNGITSYYAYDSWGKKIEETDYNGKKRFTTYTKIDGNRIQEMTTGEDDSASIIIYDDLGRKITTGQKNIDGTWSYVKTLYDIYDRPISESQPFNDLAASPTQFTTTAYDLYGRKSQIIDHTGKVTTITYSGLTTTTSDGVKTIIATKNSMGNIITMTDNGGTINYIYYPNGKLKQSNYSGMVISMEQDGWGRRTKLIDPSAGTYQYEYNYYGDLTKEITPKGTTTYVLGATGKISQKTIIGDHTNTATTYQYDPVTKLLIYNKFVDNNGGFAEYNYEYDSAKRLWKTVEFQDLVVYQREKSYDDFGRLSTEIYSVGFPFSSTNRAEVTTNRSYKNGYLWKISDVADNRVLWEVNSVNARGQILTGTYGNGYKMAKNYDAFGLPTQIKYNKSLILGPSRDDATGGTNSGPILNGPILNDPITPIVLYETITLDYVFNGQTGLLETRTNSMFNWTENFEYDNLERLVSYPELQPVLFDRFESGTGGFTQLAGAVLVNDAGQLKVTATNANSGVQKTLLTDAVAGDVVKVSVKVNRSSTDKVRITIIEKAANGLSFSYFKSYAANSTIKFEHTVSMYPNVVLKIDKENSTVDAGVSTIFYVDNLEVEKIRLQQQLYDDRGRITENALGTYNYPATGKIYQNSSIQCETEALQYYSAHPLQTVTYNAFKAPYEIREQNSDRITFRYNMENARSSIYYGSQDDDIMSRPFRKHYSTDGTMEMKHDVVANTFEYSIYIGGDAYNAPVVLKSTGTTSEYLYLHRDYLGSIVAITGPTGQMKEKRLFDAWGNVSKVKDSAGNVVDGLTVLERGYTGHEHLQSVSLIHMNGRLYDAKLHRFLQPDNHVQDAYNTQSFNRYGYVLNNPLLYSDQNGEFWFVAIGAIVGAYIGASVQQGSFNPAKWDSTWWKGAIVGGIIGAYGGNLLAGALAPAGASSLSAYGGLSTSGFGGLLTTGIEKAAAGIAKAYLSSVPSFSFDNGLMLDFSLGQDKFDKLWKAGATSFIASFLDEGLNFIYDKDGGIDGAASGIFKDMDVSKLARKVVGSTFSSVIGNTLSGEKGVFEDLTFLSLGNGFIKLGSDKVIKFNWSKLINHGLGWGGTLLAGGKSDFDLWDGASFKYTSLFKDSKFLMGALREDNRAWLTSGGMVAGAIFTTFQLSVNNGWNFSNISFGLVSGSLMGAVMTNGGLDAYLHFVKKE